MRRALGVVLLSLALPAAALAHVTVTPAYLTADAEATLTFDSPNERPPHAVVELEVVAPPGVQLGRATPPPGWIVAIDGTKATWRGGRTGPRRTTRFVLAASTDAPPGATAFTAVQRYDDGARVGWKVAFTILPSARAAPKQHLWPALLAGALGLVIIAAGLAVVRRRGQRRPLQEE